MSSGFSLWRRLQPTELEVDLVVAEELQMEMERMHAAHHVDSIPISLIVGEKRNIQNSVFDDDSSVSSICSDE